MPRIFTSVCKFKKNSVELTPVKFSWKQDKSIKSILSNMNSRNIAISESLN